MFEPLYVVLRWPKGDLYAGPFESARAFGDALLQASVVITAPRSDALRIAMFGHVRPVVPGERAFIPGTVECSLVEGTEEAEGSQAHPQRA